MERCVTSSDIAARAFSGTDAQYLNHLLRRRFRAAATTQDYRDVGNRAVAVLEALSRTTYDSTVRLRDGETEPPVDKTKQRIGRRVEDSLAGKDNEAIRGVVNKVSDLAHGVKHSAARRRRGKPGSPRIR